VPMVETSRQLSLQLMSFDVAPQQDLYTKQGVAVTVEAVAQIKVKSDPESIKTAAEQFLTKTDAEREGLIRLVMEGHLRGIIGQLSVEQIVKEPEMVGDRMRATCAEDVSKMGLEVVSFTIKEVRDKNDYITNMGRPDIARIKRDAEVAAAEADAISPSSELCRAGSPLWRKRKLTRSEYWPKHCPKLPRRKRSGILKSSAPSTSRSSSGSRRRRIRLMTYRPTSCSSRLRPRQSKSVRPRKKEKSRCRRLKSCA
jgi:hypothetical protein